MRTGPQAAQRAADEQYDRVQGIRRKWEIGDRARVAMDGRVGTVVHVFPGRNAQESGTTTLRFAVEDHPSVTYDEGFSATQLRVVDEPAPARGGVVQGSLTRRPYGRYYHPLVGVLFEKGRIVQKCGHKHEKRGPAEACARRLEREASK